MCKYIIVGKAAAGKNYAQDVFIREGNFKPCIQYTSRPRRHNESGNEYHFISDKKITQLYENNKFISMKTCTNGWKYGLSLEEFKTCDVAILSPENIMDIKLKYPELIRLTTIIYLDIPIKIRKERLTNRYVGGSEDDSMKRRIDADERDFESFDCYDIRFTNNDECIKFIENCLHNPT